MKCSNCKREIPDESIFCLYCGAKVEHDSCGKQIKTRTIKIKREKRLSSSSCVYQIVCDGQVVETIRNGETKVFELDENAHKIQCYVTEQTVIYGSINGGIYGGGGTVVSDLVNVPSGGQSAELLIKTKFASIELTLVRLYQE